MEVALNRSNSVYKPLQTSKLESPTARLQKGKKYQGAIGGKPENSWCVLDGGEGKSRQECRWLALGLGSAPVGLKAENLRLRQQSPILSQSRNGNRRLPTEH